MANYIKVTVKNNSNKEVMKKIKERNVDITIDPVSGDLYISCRGYSILKDLEEVSKEFSSSIETIQTFSTEQYSNTHMIDYINGEGILKDLQTNYMVDCINAKTIKGYSIAEVVEVRDKILKEVTKNNLLESTYEYILDNKYKFIANRKGNYVDLKVYEWQEVNQFLTDLEDMEYMI